MSLPHETDGDENDAFWTGRENITTDEGPESEDEMTQADGDQRPAEVITVRTCWDCGSQFTPTFARQWECTRCYVQGKL